MAEDIAEDVAELKFLLSQAKRSRVQSFLSGDIQTLQKGEAGDALDDKTPSAALRTVAATPAIRYTTLSSFSWEQDSEKVKIYVSVEGASEEQVTSEFRPWSFNVKVHDVGGKNYRCGIQKLNKAIAPDKSSVSVKPKRLVVTLKKADNDNWTDLYFKEDKVKPKLDSNKDPMSGLMDMMKNMYEEGDDEMKRTIAKAWSEAHAGKNPGMKRSF